MFQIIGVIWSVIWSVYKTAWLVTFICVFIVVNIITWWRIRRQNIKDNSSITAEIKYKLLIIAEITAIVASVSMATLWPFIALAIIKWRALARSLKKYKNPNIIDMRKLK